MRIAMIVPSLANKGPVIVANDLCYELIAKGHEVKLYYFNDENELTFPCPTERISLWSKIPFNEFDVIHCHSIQSDIYLRFHSFSTPKNVRKVCTLHQPIAISQLKSNFGVIKATILSTIWKSCLPVYDNIVVLNSDTLTELPGNLRKKSSIIFNGRRFRKTNSTPSHDLIAKIQQLKEHYKIIGTVSSIDYRKNLEQIVRSLPYLKDYALVAVGDGLSLESLKKLADKTKVSDRCFFMGYQSNLSWVYKCFDIFVMCSRSEGFPLSLIEAASNRLPVALSNIPIFKAIMSDSEVTFFELDNVESFVKAINNLYDRRNEFSSSIYRKYISSLTPEKMCEQYIQLYSSK